MKVIVFQGQSQYDVLRTNSSFYTRQLQEYGIDAITCDMNIVDSQMYLDIVEKFKPDFTMGLNPVCYFYENNMIHYNKTQVPHIVWLGDHPYYHAYDRALTNPMDPLVYSFISEAFFENSFKQLGIDRYTKKKFWPAEQHYQISYKNKIYPIVFFGSYTNPEKLLLELRRVCTSDNLYKIVFEFCSMIREHIYQVKTMLNEPIEIYFAEYLRTEYRLEAQQILKLTRGFYNYIDHFYRNLVRKVVLTTFAEEKLEMFVFGKEDTRDLLSNYANVKVFNPVNYAEYISILAHSKVAINITPMFTSFHERISTTLFNSTILCSNVMEGLMTEYPSILESSIFYNLDNLKETTQIISDIICEEEEYSSMVNSGLQLATNQFTYKKSIDELLNIYKNNF